MMCHILSLEFGHGNFATAILTFKLIQDGHLKVLNLDLMVCLRGLPRKCLAWRFDRSEMYLKVLKPQHHSNNNNNLILDCSKPKESLMLNLFCIFRNFCRKWRSCSRVYAVRILYINQSPPHVLITSVR